MKRAFLLIAAVILVGVVWAVPGFADPAGGGWTRLATVDRDAEDVNGNHAVAYFDGSAWRALGLASGGKNFQDRNFPVPRFSETSGPKQLRIRIAQSGGGASHIDAVTIGGKGPVSAAFLGADGTDALLLRKLQLVDHDVVDSFRKTLEVVFPADSAGHVELNARVEAEKISKTPFAFPEKNQYRKITSSSSFYTYELGSKNAFSRKPDFKVYTRPGSGHPEGWASGWIANDEDNLLFRLDFTSDNTFDGTKDYAKIYVAAGGSLRVFAQSMQDLDYGTPAFTYTDTAAYQHKVYEFKIPLEKVVMGPGTRLVRYAAEAYGTASPPGLGSVYPRLIFNHIRNLYLLVYAASDVNEEFKPYVQYYTWDMVPLGSPQAVSLNSQFYSYQFTDDILPAAAFASDGSALIVWPEFDGESNNYIYARRLDSNGVPAGGMISISTAQNSYPDRSCSVAYDPAENKYFVLWHQSVSGKHEIRGCFIPASTGVPESSFTVAADPVFNLEQPQIVYANGGFFAAWFGPNGESIVSRKFSTSGVGQGSEVSIPTADISTSLSLSYNEADQRFILVWTELSSPSKIYRRLLDADGNLIGSSLAVSSGGSFDDKNSIVVYSNKEGRYVVAWARFDYVAPSTGFYQQKLDEGGALSGSNTLIVSGDYYYYTGGAARVANTRNGDNLTITSVYTQADSEFSLSYSLYDYPNGAAPAAPVLNSPANGSLVQGTSVTLKWEQVTGSGIIYRVFCSTDQTFADSGAFVGIAAAVPTGKAAPGAYAVAGSGLLALLAATFAASGSARGSKKRLALTILVFFLAAALFSAAFLSCPSPSSSDDSTDTPPEAPVIKEHVVTGLSPATTYYWKVVTDNGEALKPSSVRSFTTQ